MTGLILDFTGMIRRAHAPAAQPLPLDWTLPLRTRSGRAARLIGALPFDLSSGDDRTHAVIVQEDTGDWTIETYFPDGRYMIDRPSTWDLINAALLDGTPLTEGAVP